MCEALQRDERRIVCWVVREQSHDEQERLERGELFGCSSNEGRLQVHGHKHGHALSSRANLPRNGKRRMTSKF